MSFVKKNNVQLPSPALHEEEEELRYAKVFFKSYYGGCGECSRYRVVDALEGEKIVGWDLD